MKGKRGTRSVRCEKKNSIYRWGLRRLFRSHPGLGTSGFKPLWESYCDSSVTISRYIRCHFRRLYPDFSLALSAIASCRPPCGLCLIKYVSKKKWEHTYFSYYLFINNLHLSIEIKQCINYIYILLTYFINIFAFWYMIS